MAKKGSKAVSVAEYLEKAIDFSGLTQRELAEAVGYTKPNIISMMKLGQTKIPIEKVPAFAKALGVDRAHFMRLVLQEYMPVVWDTVQSVMGEMLTDRERKWLELLREVDPGAELNLDTTTIASVREALRTRQSESGTEA
jgi:hypothetical protein